MSPEEICELYKCAAIFHNHRAAEEGVRALQKAGVDMNTLSIVGRDYHTEEQVTGFYNTKDRVKYWGRLGAFWGGLFGVLFAPAFFFIPGIGPILTGGVIGSAIMGMLEGGVVGAAAGGGLTALGAGLFGLGIPKDRVIAYETVLKADKYLVVVHGDFGEVTRAREILAQKGGETEIHAPTSTGQ